MLFMNSSTPRIHAVLFVTTFWSFQREFSRCTGRNQYHLHQIDKRVSDCSRKDHIEDTIVRMERARLGLHFVDRDCCIFGNSLVVWTFKRFESKYPSDLSTTREKA